MAKGANIKISVDGKTEFDRTFSRLDAEFNDLTPIWDDVRDAVWEIEEEQFQSGGAKGANGTWKPLSPAYEKAKIAKYGTLALVAGTLRATDALYKSLTRQTEDTVYQKSSTEMNVGTSLPYAKFHQRGGRNLPQRKVIDLSDAQKKQLQKAIQKSLVKQIRRRGVFVDDGTGETIG